MNIFRAKLALLGACLAIPATLAAATPSENQNFVFKVYQDLLGRTPSRTEATLYSNMLVWGATRTQVAGAITSSNEYRVDLIQDDYAKYLNRPAMAGEVAFYSNMLQTGVMDKELEVGIIAIDEYFQLAGGTYAGFVDRLFQQVLGRTADPATAAKFQDMLKRGTSRQAIASLVVHSVEADQREANSLYEKFLRRPAHTEELATFTTMLQWGTTEEILIGMLCGSDEYFHLAQSR
jgi:hypothetical protein